jgi:hypothetical protein
MYLKNPAPAAEIHYRSRMIPLKGPRADLYSLDHLLARQMHIRRCRSRADQRSLASGRKTDPQRRAAHFACRLSCSFGVSIDDNLHRPIPGFSVTLLYLRQSQAAVRPRVGHDAQGSLNPSIVPTGLYETASITTTLFDRPQANKILEIVGPKCEMPAPLAGGHFCRLCGDCYDLANAEHELGDQFACG